MGNRPTQFTQKPILRELNKAYAGFLGDPQERDGPEGNIPVNTGKWGCGMFGGNPQLKSLIQWAAASETERDMFFYAFGDATLEKFQTVVDKFGKLTVGEFVKVLVHAAENKESADLFEFLLA